MDKCGCKIKGTLPDGTCVTDGLHKIVYCPTHAQSFQMKALLQEWERAIPRMNDDPLAEQSLRARTLKLLSEVSDDE